STGRACSGPSLHRRRRAVARPGSERVTGSRMSDAGVPGPPWAVLTRETAYRGRWIGVEHWSVRLPDGSVVRDYEVLDYHRNAVAIVPIGDDGRVLLIDHYRFITGTRGWEVPAGGIEAGESVEDAAARELYEETGHRASAWQRLGAYHPSQGSSNQLFHLMLARRLARHADPLDVNETLGLRWFEAAEIRRLVVDNAIPDGLTLTALSWALIAGLIGEKGEWWPTMVRWRGRWRGSPARREGWGGSWRRASGGSAPPSSCTARRRRRPAPSARPSRSSRWPATWRRRPAAGCWRWRPTSPTRRR